VFNLDGRYADGEGVERGNAEEVRQYRTAADAGDAAAMCGLGRRYEEGRGVKQDDAEAVRWYRTAADAGVADAMFRLGERYANGRGVERDARGCPLVPQGR